MNVLPQRLVYSFSRAANLSILTNFGFFFSVPLISRHSCNDKITHFFCASTITAPNGAYRVNQTCCGLHGKERACSGGASAFRYWSFLLQRSINSSFVVPDTTPNIQSNSTGKAVFNIVTCLNTTDMEKPNSHVRYGTKNK